MIISSSCDGFAMNNGPLRVRSIWFNDLSMSKAFVNFPGPLVSCRSVTPERSCLIISIPCNGSTARMSTAAGFPGGWVVTFRQ